MTILDKEQVIQNKKSAIKALNKQLERYIEDYSQTHLKKANLISYWLKDFIEYVKFEEKFDPTRNIAYKRGNIVKVNFGFNVGSEYGGLHYGVVLDNKNDHNSPVITVIPLTSMKDNSTIHPNNVILGNEFYHRLKIKYDTISKSLNYEREQILEILQCFDTSINLAQKALDEAKESINLDKNSIDSNKFDTKLSEAEKFTDAAYKLQSEWKEKLAHNKDEQEYLDKIGMEISQMKQGSIALINQITTISKIRIFDPKNARGVLSGVSLSKESMEKINQKVKELYIF